MPFGRRSGAMQLADGSTIRFRDVERIEASHSNQAPGIAGLSASAVFDDAPEGTVVGKVMATDPDSNDSLTYALVDDAGGRFAIDPTTGTITVADASLPAQHRGPGHRCGRHERFGDPLDRREVGQQWRRGDRQ